jgi:hypothetical protein
VRIKVLYQRDYLHLLVKYGLEPPSQLGSSPLPAEVRPLRFDVDDNPITPPPGARTDNPRAESRRAESA